MISRLVLNDSGNTNWDGLILEQTNADATIETERCGLGAGTFFAVEGAKHVLEALPCDAIDHVERPCGRAFDSPPGRTVEDVNEIGVYQF